jgi:hypothetical protein
MISVLQLPIKAVVAALLKLAIALGSGMLIALFAACGGSSSGNSGTQDVEYQRVITTEKTFSIDEVKALGYKVAKSYDVSELPEASGAYYGFWTPTEKTSPVDFEVRVYPSHDIAVTTGTALADEGSGDDAVLNSSKATWDEGLLDRRRVVGPGASQGTGVPRYQDYMILGNIIVLCEGLNTQDAQDNCTIMATALN